MGIIVKAIGTGVGFIAEATSSNKSKSPTATVRVSQDSPRDLKFKDEKLALQKTSTSSSSSSEDIEPDYDSSDEESHWALDDESSKLAPAKISRDFQGQATVDSLIKSVLSQSRPPPYDIPSNGLPVILPQRRPGTKGRGFVRAYAPSLNDYGIDQDTFLSFVENLDLALKASPVLSVIFAGAGIAGLDPTGYAALASTVTQVIVGAAIEAQRRHRGNKYMDEINDKLFKPRGLFAVVMTYVPNANRPISAESTDINALIAGNAPGSGGLLGNKLEKGESYGELELPEAAPLVFPGIDEETRQKLLNENAMKRGARWTTDYMDRRGQARWLHNNPDTSLNPTVDGQKPTFNSKLGDPMHPAFQGSWPTLFSGGRIAPKQKRSKEEKRARKQERKDAQRARKGKGYDDAYGGNYVDAYGMPQSQQRSTQSKKQRKQKKKTAKSKMLYLMVLPIPNQSELREIEQELQRFAN